jgi:ankyrin repeat protein
MSLAVLLSGIAQGMVRRDCASFLLNEEQIRLPIDRNDGTTALHGAAKSCRVDVFRYLVEECGLDIDAESKEEKGRPRTPLYEAALIGDIDICNYLLGKGAKVDRGYQPLMAAAQV